MCMSAEMREERDPRESTVVAVWLSSASNDTSVTSPPEFAFDFVLPMTVASPSSLCDDRGYDRKTPSLSNLCCFIAAVNSTGKLPPVWQTLRRPQKTVAVLSSSFSFSE